MSLEPYILFEKRGEAGIVTLNREKALNALSLSMVRAFTQQLRIWATDSSITRIIVTGAGDKAFCAGGDLRSLYELVKQAHFDEALQFFKEEFQLIHAIKMFPKPYIALMDGLVMGGGFGLSAHGSHRVAGDKYTFAMPEVSIGFFPDVGATYVLPRLPHHIGEYIALTGQKIDASTALETGLLTHKVRSTHIQDIIAKLSNGGDIDRILGKYSVPPKHTQPEEIYPIISTCFSEPTLLAIIKKLKQFANSGSEFAKNTAAVIYKKSPTSLAIIFEQMQLGRTLDFESALKLEFQIISKIIHSADFCEGIRAVIIDKDQKPLWTPPSINDIFQPAIDKYFTESQNNELKFL